MDAPDVAAPVPVTRRFADRLGTRAQIRAVPRFGPVLGGAGAAVALLGVLLLSADTSTPAEDGDANHIAAALLCAAAVVAGYVALSAFRVGAAATAGSTVAAVVLPFVFVFLTFDLDEGPPFSVDLVLGASTLLWATAYAVGPGRGRPIFGGAALAGLWLFVIEQLESVFSAPFQVVTSTVGSIEGLGAPQDSPDATTIGIISLAFGVLYVAVAFLLDRRGLEGLGTPFLVIGVTALVVGYGSVGADLEPLGTGILVTLTGLVVATIGALAERRGTTWIGAAAVTVGVLLVIADLFEDSDSATVPSLVLVATGAAIAAAAELVSRLTDEPPEVIDAVAGIEPAPNGANGPGHSTTLGDLVPPPVPPTAPPPPLPDE